jgi:transcriptional regulator with GAF, ATPase, and Fis domain
MMSEDLLLAELVSIASAHACTEQPRATLQALDSAVNSLVGRKLLTVLTVNERQGTVTRAFSNLVDRYPVGGRKCIAETPRLRAVLGTGEPFVGRSKDDILANYPDAETIFAAGCGSILNFPVRWRQQVVATVNLLHDEGFYDDHHVDLVRCLAHAALPALLLDTPSCPGNVNNTRIF